jgi:hypothetical protein
MDSGHSDEASWEENDDRIGSSSQQSLIVLEYASWQDRLDTSAQAALSMS